jgi:hypothetical protein
MGNIRRITKVPQYELLEIADDNPNAYRGASVDIERRTDEHEREGSSGEVFYSHTQNMQQAEDKLLESADSDN